MTIIIYHQGDSPALRRRLLPPLLQPLKLVIERWKARVLRRRTERMLEALPAEIRKDIGWPTTDRSNARQTTAR